MTKIDPETVATKLAEREAKVAWLKSLVVGLKRSRVRTAARVAELEAAYQQQKGFAEQNAVAALSWCDKAEKEAIRAEAAEARVAELDALLSGRTFTVDEGREWRARAEAAEAKLAAKDAEVGKLRDALTGIKRAGKGRMASYGDEHSYYYFTASAALQETEK